VDIAVQLLLQHPDPEWCAVTKSIVRARCGRRRSRRGAIGEICLNPGNPWWRC